MMLKSEDQKGEDEKTSVDRKASEEPQRHGDQRGEIIRRRLDDADGAAGDEDENREADELLVIEFERLAARRLRAHDDLRFLRATSSA